MLDGTRNALPANATPFWAMAATDVTTTTEIVVKAAVTGKKVYVTQAILTNIHATEHQAIILQDDDTPNEFAYLSAPAAKTKAYTFDPPLEFTESGTSTDAVGAIAVKGDVKVTLNGYIA